MVRPQTVAELSSAVAEANTGRKKIAAVDLSRLNRVLEYTAEDLTVTVETGITLAELQRTLGRARQWLPIDPPDADPLSVEEVLSRNLSGPRRFGFGTIREHLIGLRAVLADGRLIKSGGKVVKNVAGYDLLKLFVGSEGTLGVIVEATFKLRPLPEAEQILQRRCSSLEELDERVQEILESELTPVILDLHNLSDESPGGQKRSGEECVLVLGFAGVREEVDWQINRAAQLKFTEAGGLDYQAHFFRRQGGPIHKTSVLPTRCTEAIRELGAVTFVARAGNGVIYFAGGSKPERPELPLELLRRIKDTYDPNHVFPELQL